VLGADTPTFFAPFCAHSKKPTEAPYLLETTINPVGSGGFSDFSSFSVPMVRLIFRLDLLLGWAPPTVSRPGLPSLIRLFYPILATSCRHKLPLTKDAKAFQPRPVYPQNPCR
jgi:hypothetical protein